jgi:MT0933-like antitoxin protein
MPDFSEYADKAKEFAGEHEKQTDEGVQKAGDFADQKTGDRFGSQINEGEQRAEDYLGGNQGDQGGQNQGRQNQGGQNQ